MNAVVMQGIADRLRAARAEIQSCCPPRLATAADAGLALAPGARVVDQVTGQIVEVIDGRRTTSLVQTP